MDERRQKCKIKRLVTGNRVPIMSVTCDHVNLTKNRTPDIDCDVLRGQQPQTCMALVARTNQLYSGTSSAPTETLCKTLLLIVDKSGKGTIAPTVPCRLTNCTSELAPKKQKLDHSTQIELDDSKFGSKKYQRAVNTTKKLKGTKAGSSSALEKSLMDIKEADLDVVNASILGELPSHDLATEMLPPCNRDAKDAAEVYPVSGLLSPSELSELEDAAELYLHPPTDPSTDEDFLVHPFYKDIKDKTLLKMQLLLYANSLLQFYRLKRFIPKTEGTIHYISPHSYSLGKKIMNAFTVQTVRNQRMKNERLSDRALCHAMVAILLACDNRVQLDWFSGTLKSTKNTYKIKKHVMELAKVVGLRAGANYYTLKLPLPPIQSARIPRRKKTN